MDGCVVEVDRSPHFPDCSMDPTSLFLTFSTLISHYLVRYQDTARWNEDLWDRQLISAIGVPFAITASEGASEYSVS